MPSVVAPVTPYCCSSTGPQAPAVPWPPVRVMEPVTRPISGSRPSAVARPTPTAFCTTMNAATTSRNTASGLPPAFRRPKSAARPMDEKNISMNAVCSCGWNCKLRPNASLSTTTTTPASSPPATGSGMLKSASQRILSTSQRPSSSTSVARIMV